MRDDKDLKEVLSWETTPKIKDYLIDKVSEAKKEGLSFLTPELLDEYLSTLKKEYKIKGKNLFKGTRAVLTGRAEGPDLKRFVALTPLDVISSRLQKMSI